MLHNGELQRRIVDDHLTGMTSNPTIFEKALAQGSAYDEQIGTAPELNPWELFELLETEDVRTACDAFAGVYRDTGKGDGFVSIEVSPALAHDTEATLVEARRLWETVDRPNLMGTVPGTVSGAAALDTRVFEGSNVNVTLLFSVAAHARVIEGFIRGLEKRFQDGKDISSISSVASFFVSRVDTEVDKRLAALVASGALSQAKASALGGRAAIANARMAYEQFLRSFAGPRWHPLAARGARAQRPLWASTSTKNPSYRDVIYVEQLIGRQTVNTMPPSTIDAFRDHGEVSTTLSSEVEKEAEVIARLRRAGIRIDDVTSQLLVEGLSSFQKSFDTLISGLEKKAAALRGQYQTSR
jgi:transaldolase